MPRCAADAVAVRPVACASAGEARALRFVAHDPLFPEQATQDGFGVQRQQLVVRDRVGGGVSLERPVLRLPREHGLDVGVSQTTPLLSRRDQVTGEMEGFEIDLINRIATGKLGPPKKLIYDPDLIVRASA